MSKSPARRPEGVEILRGTIWRDVWHVAARRLRGTSWHVVSYTSRHVAARRGTLYAVCGAVRPRQKSQRERSASRHFEQREHIFSVISPLFACVASLNAKRDIATQGPALRVTSWHVVARRFPHVAARSACGKKGAPNFSTPSSTVTSAAPTKRKTSPQPHTIDCWSSRDGCCAFPCRVRSMVMQCK